MNNWYKEGKKDRDLFDYNREHNNMWDNLLRLEQDRCGIKFSTENNEFNSSKTLSIDLKGEFDPNSVYAEAWVGCGDWECPILYYRCQYKNKSSSTVAKFIFIPKDSESNPNLLKSNKKDEDKTPRDADGECREIKPIWDHVKNEAEKRYNASGVFDGYDKSGLTLQLKTAQIETYEDRNRLNRKLRYLQDIAAMLYELSNPARIAQNPDKAKNIVESILNNNPEISGYLEEKKIDDILIKAISIARDNYHKFANYMQIAFSQVYAIIEDIERQIKEFVNVTLPERTKKLRERANGRS
jgi:hypothetical protein